MVYGYEPEGRVFESLRAHHRISKLREVEAKTAHPLTHPELICTPDRIRVHCGHGELGQPRAELARSARLPRGEPEEFEIAYSPLVDLHLIAQVKRLAETARPCDSGSFTQRFAGQNARSFTVGYKSRRDCDSAG
jgi:hypothetical protein